MTRVALYARYSSEVQNERSIEDQLEVCRRHAQARGWTVTATYQDAAISGAAMANRPGLLALLAAAERADFDLVLVEDEDRLARNLEHLAHIASRLDFAGVRLATLATDQVEEMHVAFKGLQASQYLKNLSQKTRRGMQSNAERGLATGSRVYGYRSRPGGAVEILEDQAAVIRRVFTDFAGGLTARDIAEALNAEGLPGPRGGHWNASTIQGSRQRGNGLLRTALYAGVKVWNRVEMRKDPRTGVRLSRARPAAEWRSTPVPQLRIVDQADWDAVQARLSASPATAPGRRQKRNMRLFSGLLRCGGCGASYTSYTAGRLICAGHRERGAAVCDNRRTPERADVERRILTALQTKLLAPQAVAAYVRAYHQAWAAERDRKAADRAPLERRLGEISRKSARLVAAIEDGTATPAMLQRIRELEVERLAAEAELASSPEAPPPIALHPRLAEVYAARIGQLHAHLALAVESPDAAPADRQLVEAVRDLVDAVIITPRSQARGADYALSIKGRLALFIQHPEQTGHVVGRALVAGARYTRDPYIRCTIAA